MTSLYGMLKSIAIFFSLLKLSCAGYIAIVTIHVSQQYVSQINWYVLCSKFSFSEQPCIFKQLILKNSNQLMLKI